MKYRRFGKTELSMPLFSCGGMRYSFPGKDTPLDEIPAKNQENLEITLRRALQLGINHFETARGYGNSERQMGLVLPKLPREEIIVQTKVPPNADPKVFEENFHDSLARLNVEYLDLFAIHGIVNEETLQSSIKKGGCLDVARKLQAQGLVRHVGFSTHGPTDIMLRAIQHDNGKAFDYINLHWYYIRQECWPAIEEANKNDMGVFIISPSDKGGMLWKPSKKLLEITAPLHPMQFNDLFCLSHPQVHTLSIGASKPGDFDLHYQTLDLLDNAPEHLAPIIARLQNAVIESIGPEFLDPFDLNLPPWQDCPDEINPTTVTWLWSLAKAYDMIEFGKYRYGVLGNAGPWLPGKKPETIDEAAWKDIAKNSKVGPKLIDILREAKLMFGKLD